MSDLRRERSTGPGYPSTTSTTNRSLSCPPLLAVVAVNASRGAPTRVTGVTDVPPAKQDANLDQTQNLQPVDEAPMTQEPIHPSEVPLVNHVVPTVTVSFVSILIAVCH